MSADKERQETSEYQVRGRIWFIRRLLISSHALSVVADL